MRPWKQVKPILIAAAGCLVLGTLGAFAYIKSGLYDVGASKPHTRFTEWVTHETMIHSVRRHAQQIVGRQQWVSGMEPAPPYLLDINQRFTRSQLFSIVKNGIKMTGMPSWRNEMSDEQIWTVVAWIETSANSC